jgi:4-amino-4-deoxy-L-arabinose transferase-like glycosyltransferase
LSEAAPPEIRPLAWQPVLLIVAAVAIALIAGAGGYGYHRDELYFLEAGRHLGFGYPDQGPLTPLLARLMSDLDPGSLTVLRLPSAVMAAAVVFVTGLLTREIGGGRTSQIVATGCCAVASAVLAVGHLLSTTTFDLLDWSVVCLLVVRAIRTESGPLWLAAGAVAGVGLLNKPLPAFLLLALGIAALAVGPRSLLRSGWVWAGALLALAIWSPWLIWQAQHHWPQLKVSSAIAKGGSASSQSRWALLPFQFLLVSPVLAPVWVAGLLGPFRSQALAWLRLFPLAWVVLAVIFTATGGKPYYLAGMFPILLALGSVPVARWLQRGRARGRKALLAAGVVLSGLVSATIALPLLPAKDAGPVVAMNADVGETIGWPEFVRQVAGAYRAAGPDAVIFTRNYGEAGAVDRYGSTLGLPDAYSGHNGFGYWGPPPDGPGQVVLVGLTPSQESRSFAGCRPYSRISNRAGIDNEENRRWISICRRPVASWSALWPRLRHLN